jgi:cyclopropane fatty-acyl-phospholipid synthase-like methyltransferase
MEKPFSPACERNRQPILDVLGSVFADRKQVLEIGSGTGQHAVHFAAAMPRLIWQTSDRSEHLAGIRSWLDDAALDNTPSPIELDVAGDAWPAARYDAIFTANTLHIMSWTDVERFFARLPTVTTEHALLAVYGPFNIDGRYTSDSNAAFDASLKQRAAHMGIRDLEAVHVLAAKAGFTHCVGEHALPANNRLVIWRRASID